MIVLAPVTGNRCTHHGCRGHKPSPFTCGTPAPNFGQKFCAPRPETLFVHVGKDDGLAFFAELFLVWFDVDFHDGAGEDGEDAVFDLVGDTVGLL